MANRPQGEGLEGLTAERLEELALSCINVADQREEQAIAEASWPDLAALLSAEAHDNRQLATLCRVVANAERAMRANAIRDGYSGQYFLSDDVEIRVTSDERAHSTLAAALASIHPEAGGTA